MEDLQKSLIAEIGKHRYIRSAEKETDNGVCSAVKIT